MLINTYSNLFFTMTAYQKNEGIESILMEAKRMVNQSVSEQNIAFLAEFYYTEAFYFRVKHENEKALKSYEKAISIYKTLPDSNRNNYYFITFYFSAIQLLISKGNHNKVIAYLLEIASLRKNVTMLEKARPSVLFKVIDFLNLYYSTQLDINHE